MEYKFYCFTLILIIYITGVSPLIVVPSSNPVAAGRNVTLTLNPATTIIAGNWLFEGNVMVFWYKEMFILEGSYGDRASFNSSSLQLSLGFVNVNDSGVYALQGASPPLRAQVVLSVQEPVTNVSFTVSQTNLVEFNDSVTLTCSAHGTQLNFSWQNSSSAVTSGDRVQLSSGGSVLTITNVTRYDQGPFTCVVVNGVSNGTSGNIYFNISYGPSNLTMIATPQKTGYISGSDITLTCSADSSPSAWFFWSYNNISLSTSGQNLQLTNATQNQTGTYTCTAHNTVTLRYTTASKTIFILDPVSSAIVTPSVNKPIFNMSFTLSCDIMGPVDSTYWEKNGMYLHSDSRILISNQNKTLLFTQLTLADDGDYQCVASNPVSNMTSVPYRLMVNYGPWNISVYGPAIAAASSSLALNCSASSQPPSKYTWNFNGSEVAAGSTYRIGALSLNDSGEYTCVAYNNITGRSSNATWELTVIDIISSATVVPSGNQIIFNMSFTLSCDIMGPVDSTYWEKNGMYLHSDSRILLSNQNKTLLFTQLTLADDGDYQCVASNPVSNMTSVPYRLMVNYGPWSSTISGPAIAEAGSNVTLKCSARSRPPSEYSWYFRGSNVAKGPVFETGLLSLSSSGQYTCVAHNNITAGSTSATWNLTVIKAVFSVVVTPSMLVPLVSKHLQLFCNITGVYSSIQWLKDGQAFSPTPTATISLDNTTLAFQPLQIVDDGIYQCAAENAIGNHISKPYKLNANYGPVSLTITAEVRLAIVLTCDAKSHPLSVYHWIFNNTNIGEGATIFISIMSALGSNYTCVARNPLTNVALSGSYIIPDPSDVAPLQASALLTSSLALILAVSVL
ncbi:carcinoembryonic antigen-related cell adhesion molecule 1 [Brachyhypopomus gauderio]|uniref:carcinoembryonic antigen-related cell adhesion molecule 1 n=1 Tax=Brachyhypopomus gauderio TaxID=698409 RepID=UPI00404110B9